MLEGSPNVMRPYLRRMLGILVSPIFLLALVSSSFVAVHVPQNTQISPLDEYVYIDYLSKVPTQGFVRSGEETGDLARSEIACRGVINYGTYGDPCGAPTHDSDSLYPYGGQTGADLYTPLYFATTWVIAQPFVAAGVGLLDAGRLVGMVWLSLGTCLLFGLLRALGTPRPVALGLPLLVIATPAIFWATTYISTDAPTLAVCAGVAWAGVAVYQRRLAVWWLPVLAVLAVLFKLQNLGIVGVVAVGLIVITIVDVSRRRSRAIRGSRTWATGKIVLRDRLVWTSVVSVVAVFAAQAIWMVFRSGEALRGVVKAQIDSVQNQFSATSLLRESLKFVFTVGQGGASGNLIGIAVAALLTAASLAAIVGVLLKPQGVPASTVVVAGSTLAVALAMGPALVIATTLAVGYSVPLPERYGISLLPAFIGCIGLFLVDSGKKTGIAVAILGVSAAVLATLT